MWRRSDRVYDEVFAMVLRGYVKAVAVVLEELVAAIYGNALAVYHLIDDGRLLKELAVFKVYLKVVGPGTLRSLRPR